MILAGGRGRRMGVFCQERAKPSLHFAGSARVIDFTLSNCVNSLIPDVAVLVDYQRQSMADYLNRWSMSHQHATNLHVIQPGHGSFLGTADAVYQNIDFLQSHHAERVIVLAGDHVYRMNYQPLLAYHRQTGADATIAVMPVSPEDAHRFGVVTVKGRVGVTDFIEKPARPSGNLVSMGIYVFSKDVLIRRLREDAANPASSHDFGHDIIPLMTRKDKVAAYRFNRYWRDIGTPQAYYESSLDFLPEAPQSGTETARGILTEVTSELPPRVRGDGNVINSIISSDCVIKGRVENSVLSPGVRVEEGAVVRDSVLMADVYVGERTLVDGCLVGEDAYIDKFCKLGSRNIAARDVTVLGDKVAVPPLTYVKAGATLTPDDGNDVGRSVRFVSAK